MDNLIDCNVYDCNAVVFDQEKKIIINAKGTLEKEILHSTNLVIYFYEEIIISNSYLMFSAYFCM